jgi:PAS domain S-box-containing protein
MRRRPDEGEEKGSPAEAADRATPVPLRSEQHFQLLVEIAQEGIWTTDPENRTTYVNRYMAEILGYTVTEMMGRPLFDFMDEEGRELATRNLERRRQGIAESHDFKLMRKDGQPVWALLSSSPILDKTGTYIGALATVADVTQRRAAEEQVRQLNKDLEQRIAERTAQLERTNQELESFAYSVAHELRNPLRGISTFSEALSEDYAAGLDEGGLDYLRRIRASTQRMAGLIDGILALSRVSRVALAQQECDLSVMARNTLEHLQRLEPGRNVRFTCQDGLVDRGDAQLLHLVLENLLGNAWKFTRARPVAEITFGASPAPAGGRIYFVRDNGAGFDMAYQNKLFGVFQRLHTQQQFEGTGIGLATVQRIIRRHAGRVWAEGQVDAGATFSFTLWESSGEVTAPIA